MGLQVLVSSKETSSCVGYNAEKELDMDNLDVDKLIADAQETRDLRRERLLGMLIGFIIGIFLCSCSSALLFYWLYQIGSSLPK